MKYNYLLLSDLLRSTRLEKNYSARALAREVGISDTELARIENGIRKNINLITLVRICEVLDIDFVKLLKVTGYFPHTYSRVIFNQDRVNHSQNIYHQQGGNLKCSNCEYFCPVCKTCVIKGDIRK